MGISEFLDLFSGNPHSQTIKMYGFRHQEIIFLGTLSEAKGTEFVKENYDVLSFDILTDGILEICLNI